MMPNSLTLTINFRDAADAARCYALLEKLTDLVGCVGWWNEEVTARIAGSWQSVAEAEKVIRDMRSCTSLESVTSLAEFVPDSADAAHEKAEAEELEFHARIEAEREGRRQGGTVHDSAHPLPGSSGFLADIVDQPRHVAVCGPWQFNDNPEACPGCGANPADGITDNCDDPDGCGFWRMGFDDAEREADQEKRDALQRRRISRGRRVADRLISDPRSEVTDAELPDLDAFRGGHSGWALGSRDEGVAR
jgi:hypothetical protein